MDRTHALCHFYPSFCIFANFGAVFRSIQLVCFLATEFPVQMLIKRYGFKRILPTLMICWGLVSTFQYVTYIPTAEPDWHIYSRRCFTTNRTGFYITRALIGACEGGFIPGTM